MLSGWMALRGPLQTMVLGLVLRLLLLLGLGLGAEASPTWSPAQTLGPSPGSCLPTHFQCRITGYCMPLAWHCDGDWDCPDGSDEEECNGKPCSQDRQCPPPVDSPCSCDSIDGCKNLPNCSSQPCRAGELRCPLGGTCIPPTWLCDGHPDCVDSSDELGCGTETLQESTSVGIPVTPESVTYLRNTTFGRVKDSVQSRSRSASGVLAAAVVLSAGLVAATLFVLSQLCAKGLLSPLKLLLERNTSPF